MPQMRLFRSRKNRIIAGVAGGLAEYLNVDPSLVRLIWALVAVFGGGGVLVYLIAWFVIPEEGSSDGADVIEENPAKYQSNNAVQYMMGILFLVIGLLCLAFTLNFMFFSRLFLACLSIGLGILILAGVFWKR